MTITRNARSGIVFLVVALGACDGPIATSIPTSPSGPTTAPVAPVAPVVVPVLTVTAITPNLGSTGGDTFVTITGTGFRRGMSVSFGDAKLPQTVAGYPDSTGTVYLYVPAHAAGTVDVTLTNPGGTPHTMAAGYTFASPESFEFNGSWSGFGGRGQDIPILFTIKDNALVSVSCDTYETLTFSPGVPVTNGEFSYSGANGVAVFGKIVSALQAVGTINLAACAETYWGADKL